MGLTIKGLWKTIIWMILGFILFYMITGDIKMLGLYFVIRTIMYYVYDRLWEDK